MSNTFTVVGNLTGEPELRFTQGGVPICSGGIASNRRYQVNGEWQEQTSFFNFTAWRDLAENMAATLSKGMRVIATGRLEQKNWVDKEGKDRTTFDFVIDEIGPSLRWATADVTRKSGNNNGSVTTAVNNVANAGFAYTEEDPF